MLDQLHLAAKLVEREVTPEPLGTRRAEGATDCTSHLGGDAEGVAAVEHRLDP